MQRTTHVVTIHVVTVHVATMQVVIRLVAILAMLATRAMTIHAAIPWICFQIQT
jgi:hypothetical protein